MKNSSSMKMLSAPNNYLFQDYSTYNGTNNYKIIDNNQPNKPLQRQESSSLLSVNNNLLNTNYQSQQKIQQIYQVPNILQNNQQIITPMKSEPKIIRIQKKVFRRIPSGQLSPRKNMEYYQNLNRNLSMDFRSYNGKINNYDNIQKNFSLINVKPEEEISLNNYEITTPIKNNKIVSYNYLNPIERYNNTSPKEENKFTITNSNILPYSDYKKYNSLNSNNINNSANINYLTDVVQNDNDGQVNKIIDTKINTSMNNLTNNYLQHSYNNSNYNINPNHHYQNSINYTDSKSTNDINSIRSNLFNTYYSNTNNNNYIQTDVNNPNNYNIGYSQNSNLKNFYSSNDLKMKYRFKNDDYNRNVYSNINTNTNTQIKMKPQNFIRSISSGNIRYYKRDLTFNKLNKNEFNPTKKIQNITIIKDPITPNNFLNYKGNSSQTQQMTYYNNTNPIQNNNNGINNNYNINFNININQEYYNPNNSNNKYNINTPNNNYIPISFPELEPSSNFKLSEFIIIGTVGKGTEGTIYLVKWKKNNKKYALKKGIIKMIELVKKHQEEINLLQEFRRKTGSDGVINVYGYLCLANKTNSYDFYEIMELAEIDWDKEIERRARLGKFYPEHELMNIMYQIVQTLALLQKNHITHRDIKPQNIILVNGKYKIIDFGNARILKRGGLVVQRIRGSEMYMSPLMFKAYHSKMERIKHNTFKSDVFSLGMCFLLAATLSYDPLNTIREEFNYSTLNRYVRHFMKRRYSENIHIIILSMLQIEENLRPDFVQLETLFKEINGYI